MQLHLCCLSGEEPFTRLFECLLAGNAGLLFLPAAIILTLPVTLRPRCPTLQPFPSRLFQLHHLSATLRSCAAEDFGLFTADNGRRENPESEEALPRNEGRQVSGSLEPDVALTPVTFTLCAHQLDDLGGSGLSP